MQFVVAYSSLTASASGYAGYYAAATAFFVAGAKVDPDAIYESASMVLGFAFGDDGGGNTPGDDAKFQIGDFLGSLQNIETGGSQLRDQVWGIEDAAVDALSDPD